MKWRRSGVRSAIAEVRSEVEEEEDLRSEFLLVAAAQLGAQLQLQDPRRVGELVEAEPLPPLGIG